jgi:hypothetical protein
VKGFISPSFKKGRVSVLLSYSRGKEEKKTFTIAFNTLSPKTQIHREVLLMKDQLQTDQRLSEKGEGEPNKGYP